MGEDFWRHGADNSEMVDAAIERREDERLHGLTVVVVGRAARLTMWQYS